MPIVKLKQTKLEKSKGWVTQIFLKAIFCFFNLREYMWADSKVSSLVSTSLNQLFSSKFKSEANTTCYYMFYLEII